MNMTADFQAIENRLKALPSHIQAKVVKRAARAGAKVIADDAKSRVPIRSGLLRKSIAVVKKSKRYTKQGHVSYLVTTKKKTKFRVAGIVGNQSVQLRVTGYAYYAHMIEFGTVKMPPNPFMRPAFEGSAQESIDAFKDSARSNIDKEIENLRRIR